MSRLAVACCWVHANVPYTVEYVRNLRAMVAKHLQRPHSFVCLTDKPQLMPPGVASILIHHDPKLFGWWAKVQLFNPAHDLGDRVLYLDLDTVVVNDLTPIVDYPAPFALVPDTGHFRPRNGLQVVRRFNSSVMVWTAGVGDRLFQDWTPDVASRLWGDQDWIGEQSEAVQMPVHWFPRLSEITHLSAPPLDARVVLCKKPKNTIAADLYPWVDKAWRAA